MYSRDSQPVQFERDCPAVMVPHGQVVVLPAGSYGYITQALGGSFTVYVEGNLFRIAGVDADAIGQELPQTLTLPNDADDDAIEQLLWQQLRTCFDPEIPVNIVDLGLVYAVQLHPSDTDPAQRVVRIEMTLTAPGCGMGDVLVDDVRHKLLLVPMISRVDVALVFDPPWNRQMMSEAARLETGFF